MRFTIRDLLWITMVVALGIGWWMTHRKASESERRVLFYVQIVERLQAENYRYKREASSTERLVEKWLHQTNTAPNSLPPTPNLPSN